MAEIKLNMLDFPSLSSVRDALIINNMIGRRKIRCLVIQCERKQHQSCGMIIIDASSTQVSTEMLSTSTIKCVWHDCRLWLRLYGQQKLN